MPHLIFDCDGVLVDCEPLSMKVDVEILAENGVVMSEEEAHPASSARPSPPCSTRCSREFGVQLSRRCFDPQGPAAARTLRARTEARCDGVDDALRGTGPASLQCRLELALRAGRGRAPHRPAHAASSATASPPSSMWRAASPNPTCSSRRPGAPAIRRRLHRHRGFGDRRDRGASRRLPGSGFHRNPPAPGAAGRPSCCRRGAASRFQPHGRPAACAGFFTLKECFDIALQHAHMGACRSWPIQEYVRRTTGAAVPARIERHSRTYLSRG